MAQEIINVGSVQDDGTGDIVRDAFVKCNNNFTEVYGIITNPLSKQVDVYTISDFPAESGGVITLDPETVYKCFANINFGATRIISASNSVITGAGSTAIVLTYTGNAAFITSVNNAVVISDLTILAQTAGGSVLAFSTVSLKIARISDCTIVCDRFADYSGTDWAARISDTSIFPFSTGAITCSGTCRSFNYDTAGVVATSGVFLDLGSCVFESGVLRTIIGEFPTGTTFISGLPNSGNVTATGRFYVEGCQIDLSGGGTDLSGVTPNDTRWNFRANTPIPDTRRDFLISFEGNVANVTTILAIGAYVKVNAGTLWIQGLAPTAFTTDNTGTVTYIGVEDLTIPVDATMSLEPVSGANKDLAVKIAQNGVVVGPALPRRTDSGNPGVVAFPWQLEVKNGDTLEVFVANLSDNTNILVGGGIFRGD